MCRFASEIPVEEERRSFFRRSMLIFPAIHKVWRRQIALIGKKSLNRIALLIQLLITVPK